MNVLVLVSFIVFFVIIMMLTGLWIAVSLGLVGAANLLLLTSYPISRIIPKDAFNSLNSFTLTAMPSFILMGEIMIRSGLTKYLFDGITPWVERIPGRLIHSNILSCTVFAAISGSSTVTTAVIGGASVPELFKRKYDEGLTLGSICGAGTLGLMIPPSAPMIIYGAATGESIGQLFMAGLLPGLMIAGLFMTYVVLRCLANPTLAPQTKSYTWSERLTGLGQVLPSLGIIFLVLGGIYFGFTTPTEAGIVGIFAALIASYLKRALSWQLVKESIWATMKTNCMIMFIVVGASILSTSMIYLNIPVKIVNLIVSVGLSKWLVFAILILLYLGMGCLFDGISMLLLTLPIVYPLITNLGFNGIWFGIILVVMVEAAQITPPVGINLYVLQSISGRSIDKIFKPSFAFFLLLVLAVVILSLLPEMALWLPKKLVVAKGF
jgi:C4-dicarboxylate transporter, DctM subunit